MNETAFPTIAQWRRLHQAAAAFRKLAPWRWMNDNQLFAVQEAPAGPIGYCCVLGALGKILALAVYPGSEGFGSFLRLQNFDARDSDVDFFYRQRCLMASWETRQRLDKEDRAIIAQLGLRFRGRDAWPLFRSHRPGYLPWFLEPSEVRLLTLALERGLALCQRLQNEPDHFPLDDGRRILTLMPGRDGAGFETHWTAPPAVQAPICTMPPIDEVRLQRMRKVLEKKEGALEFDWFYVPSAIREKGRPYFPRAVAVVDSTSGLALGIEMIEPRAGVAQMAAVLLRAMEKSGNLPSRLCVRRPELATALERLTARLRLRLEIHERMEALENFRDHLQGHFGRAVP